MSLQIFLQGKIVGTEPFLRSSANDIDGRAYWLALLSEIIPRALLSELRLSPMLLGASGGGRFLLLIPAEVRGAAEEFCSRVGAKLAERSGQQVCLVWAITENLGVWSDIRNRLEEDLRRKVGTPAAAAGDFAFEPGTTPVADDFTAFATGMRSAQSIGWSAEHLDPVVSSSGDQAWPLTSIALARHVAMNDQDISAAGLRTLGARAKGRRIWGVLRGSVDGLEGRLLKNQTIEEHLAMSEMYKRFFAGELGVLSAMPDFWRKITILSASPGRFAIYGAWDALIDFSRELQRVFQVFIETNLRDHAGSEGKTVSMALALARSSDQPLVEVFAEAGDRLTIAKAAGRDSIYILHRVLEWKQLSDAAEIRQVLTRLIKDFRCSPDLLNELASFYRESDARQGLQSRTRNDRVGRPWRFHRRINMVLGTSRNKDFQRLRSELISDFTGKKAAQVRLRPQGRVALEWTRLETGV